MDPRGTAGEVGVITLMANIEEVRESEEVRSKVGAVVPLPGEGFSSKIPVIAEWISDFNKNMIMFISPEINLIEAISPIIPKLNAIIVVPSDMDEEVKERVADNIPKCVNTTLLYEPFFPETKFRPNNGLIVACGYKTGGRLMVLPETYRLIEHYDSFYGKKVFIPYISMDDAIRYPGWMEISRTYFDDIWKECDEE